MLIRVQNQNFGTNGIFQYQFHEKTYNYPFHIHQFMEFVLMLDGEMEVIVDDRIEKLGSGQMAMIFPFNVHSYRSDSESKFAIFNISPHLVSDFINATKGKIGDRTVFTLRPSTSQMFTDRLLKETDLSLYGIRACFYAAISDFSAQTHLVDASDANNIISVLINYINTHCSEKITLEETAKAIGYSANYLSHRIKRSCRMNFCTLLAYIRIENAKALLAESDLPILEVAIESGFGSERSFHRHFKKVTGLTPREFKNESHLTTLKLTKNSVLPTYDV